MSSFVTPHEENILTGLLDRVVQTFQRDIIVWKSPIQQTIINNQFSGVQTFGFGTAPEADQYTYTPVSGIFPAVVRYLLPRHIGEANMAQDTNSFIPVGEVKIKVRPDCYNFIESGATDKISFDNRDFYFVGKVQARPFLGSLYYQYQLKQKV